MKDAGGFEGNAQTLRILSKLEKKGEPITPSSAPHSFDERLGLNLTHRSLAAVLKYDNIIPIENIERTHPDSICKGYYASEKNLVERLKKSVIGKSKYNGPFKTIECQIMDLADDIAYSTYDLEDALKAEFVSPMEILADTSNRDLMERIAKKVEQNVGTSFGETEAVYALLSLFIPAEFFEYDLIEKAIAGSEPPRHVAIAGAIMAITAFDTSKMFSKNGYHRNRLTTTLVDGFIQGIECKWDPVAPAFSKVHFSKEILPQVETLKHYTYEKLIASPRMKVAEFRGYEIVSELFKTLHSKGASLLPDDFKEWHNATPNEVEKKRVICDFIAGMTDRYAIEFYGRLHSESPQTIFKPL